MSAKFSETIHVYEVEVFEKGVWSKDEKSSEFGGGNNSNGGGWYNQNMEHLVGISIENYPLPLSDKQWSWTSNWRFVKQAEMTDSEGWEYASRMERFGVEGRKSKPAKLWNDKYRRRLWARVMARQRGDNDNNPSDKGGKVDVSQLIPRVQKGLTIIHNVRARIEQHVQANSNNGNNTVIDQNNNAQLVLLVNSVRKNVKDIVDMIDTAEASHGNTGGTGGGSGSNSNAAINRGLSALRKLKNDCLKEEEAIEAALARLNIQYGDGNNNSNSTNNNGNNEAKQQQSKAYGNSNNQQFQKLAIANKSQSLNFVPSRSGSSGITNGLAGNNSGNAAKQSLARDDSDDYSLLTTTTSASNPTSVLSRINSKRQSFAEGTANSPGSSGASANSNSSPVTVFNSNGNSNINNTSMSKRASSSTVPPIINNSGGSVSGGKSGSDFSLDDIVLNNKNSSANAALANNMLLLDGAEAQLEGTYISKNVQRQLIEQQLKVVDEATVMQEYINERNEAIEEVYKGLVEVNEMFKELSQILRDHQPDIDTICANVEETHDKTRQGLNDILKAEKMQQEGSCTIS